MRILFINQFFWPDAAATGQFLTDVSRHLVQLGHEVTVICSRNSYAEASSDADTPPVTIIRASGMRFGRSISARGLSYLSFFAGAFWKAFRIPRPDLVVTLTTPPLLSLLGTALKLSKGSRHYIWEMDLFPDAFVALNALRAESWITRVLGVLADYSRKRSEGIIALGPCMKERLLERGIPPRLIHIGENWADGEEIAQLPFPEGPELNILYSGNFGLSHDVDTIAGAMKMLSDDGRFRFLFAGGGAGREALQRTCAEERIQCASFLPYTKREDLGLSLANGHIGLVTERDPCIGTVVPSKVYALLAAGRPLLFIGPRAATPALIIQQHECGWQVDCGDTKSLVALLRTLHEQRHLIEMAGARARAAFIQHYDLRQGVSRIANILEVPQMSRIPNTCATTHQTA